MTYGYRTYLDIVTTTSNEEEHAFKVFDFRLLLCIVGLIFWMCVYCVHCIGEEWRNL